MTAAALSKDVNNVFKCGISVAPVTSWIYYGKLNYYLQCLPKSGTEGSNNMLSIN